MAERPQNLRALYADADKRREAVENSWDSNGDEYQENLREAIATYGECLKTIDRISLFSPNETLEDISSSDLQYLLVHHHVGNLVQRTYTSTGSARKALIEKAQDSYSRFLKLLDTYDALSAPNARLYEAYLDSTATFTTTSTTDATQRRTLKIARFKEEKVLKEKLSHLKSNPLALQNDDDALRKLHLTAIDFAVHQTFASLDSITDELQILSLRPPTPPEGARGERHVDLRENGNRGDNYSERLDTPHVPLTQRKGPILDSSGRPLRPFTLLDKRAQLRDGVFRPDHSLPTMSIDEYLEEERKRGGMIEGGGEASGMRPEPNEDDFEKADEETMKARAWDEFVEENPKGSGNTLNMG